MNRLHHTYTLCTLLLLLWAGSSCNRDAVDGLTFQVKTEGGVNIVKTDQEIHFLLEGNADYIVFYSGEEGSNYDHRTRTEAEIASLTMSCEIKQQYNDLNYWGKEIFHIYLSTDFSGAYTPEAANRATWIPLSGKEYGHLPVPVPSSASAVSTSGSIDLSAYTDINKPFYIAFQYNAFGRDAIPASNGGGRYTNRPRIDVTGLTLRKVTAEGQVVEQDNAISQWAFQPILQQSATGTNYQVNDNGLLFQPQKATIDATTGREPDEIVWMVSGPIHPRQMEPDRGTPIQSIEARLTTYSYAYRKAGNYTATFVASNANLWDSTQKVSQVTIQVQEP